ncbi:DUF4163 domain-containing protein [Aurantiacibacter sp. D1-12]|uniref:DUF4163 domain-containing protein n=1 Tax=Aurantiacibacter sp. D1-12 TaxID=2993658 RepID=UPI00237D31E6|nr:DUF4163 domain-containing protein [Aurantiacibacter sp. D1-12]MDE1466974.1 DUF4163 domain-containing protein [Aurantiacibacter sp. D1-12]
MFSAPADPNDPPRPPDVELPDGTVSPVPVGGARTVSEETDLFFFEYSYPQAAGEIPQLAQWLDQLLDRRRQALAAEAAEGRERARSNGFPFNSYSSGTAWEVVADLPGWLSLSAALDSYQGGAHPNYGFDAIVWDKANDRALEPIAMFTSAEALDGALGERLCDALNAEREQRRGMPVDQEAGDGFNSCITPDETNLLLGSSSGERFDRIGIQIAPYLAGPYAEGSYEFTFVVDEQILEIVKPQYREAFGAPQ